MKTAGQTIGAMWGVECGYELLGAHVSSVCFSVQESMAREPTDKEEDAPVGKF